MTRILAIGMTFPNHKPLFVFVVTMSLKISVAPKVTNFLCSLGHDWEVTQSGREEYPYSQGPTGGPELEAGLVEISVPTGEKC